MAIAPRFLHGSFGPRGLEAGASAGRGRSGDLARGGRALWLPL